MSNLQYCKIEYYNNCVQIRKVLLTYQCLANIYDQSTEPYYPTNVCIFNNNLVNREYNGIYQ